MLKQLTARLVRASQGNKPAGGQWLNHRIAGGVAILIFFAMLGAASAQTTDPMAELLKTMTEKGMLTEQEAQKIKAAADAERADQEALKSEFESNITNNDYSSASKWRISKGIKDIELFGDVRLRYENREAWTPDNANRLELGRYRYALRIGLRGDLCDDFYYGMRVETAANPRSPWVTFGTSSSGVPYQGPFGKSTAGLNLGLIYLGWRPASWIDVTVGKMPMPLYTTSMMFDTDINPEGAAEHLKYSVGPVDFQVTLGQFLYQDVNPVHTSPFLVPSIPLGQETSIPFLLAWQSQFIYHIKKDMSVKAAFTVYNYTGVGQDTSPGATPAVPGFSDVFVGAGAGVPINGASGYPGGPWDGFTYNQTGINNLFIVDVPFEFNFKISSLYARFFGDVAENLDGSQRAQAAVDAGLTNTLSNPITIPLFKHDNKAYQAGFSIGNSPPGLVYGSGQVKRNAWEARAYWQHVEQYALDPNLLDSDFFEGRGNLQGLYSAVSYGFTESIIGTVRYGFANRINHQLGTGGSNQDIPQVNPINHYQLLQFDLTWKF